MRNKIKTCLFALIIMGVITLCLTYKSKNEVITKTKKKKSNIAIMIKSDNEDDYFESTAKEIPKGQYYNLEQARGPFEIDLNTLNLDVILFLYVVYIPLVIKVVVLLVIHMNR